MGVRRMIQGMLGRGWCEPEETSTPAKAESATQRVPADGTVETHLLGTVEFRVVWIGGKPWAIADNLATGIGYDRGSRITRHVSDKNLIRDHKMVTSAGTRYVTLISKRGVFEVFMAVNKPETEPFREAVLDLLEAIDEGRVQITSANQTRIRPWIGKVQRRYGHSLGWGKRRQRIADGNKAKQDLIFAKEFGGDADLIAKHYNSQAFGLFKRKIKQLRNLLGMSAKSKASPLDRVGDNAAAWYDAANQTLLQKMKDGSVSKGNLLETTESIAGACRQTALQLLGPEYDFGVVENASGHKVLDVERKKLPDQKSA